MIHEGDSRAVLDRLCREGFVADSIVTDPPYGLVSIAKRFGKAGAAPALSNGPTGVYKRLSDGFIGQQWDSQGVERDPEFWKLCRDVLKPGGFLLAFAGTRTWHRIGTAIEAAGFDLRDTVLWLYGTGWPKSHTQPDGSGTMLKPAWEPVMVFQRPVVGTIAKNIAVHGVGGLRIEDCRVQNGNWPANVVTDGETLLGERSRLFYCAKASKEDRNTDWQGGRIEIENRHPTVKPNDLMRWLCRLGTPLGGTVLDPFAGSGSTGKAARMEGFQFVGIEADPASCEVARRRIGAPGSDFEEALAALTAAAQRNKEARDAY